MGIVLNFVGGLYTSLQKEPQWLQNPFSEAGTKTFLTYFFKLYWFWKLYGISFFEVLFELQKKVFLKYEITFDQQSFNIYKNYFFRLLLDEDRSNIFFDFFQFLKFHIFHMQNLTIGKKMFKT